MCLSFFLRFRIKLFSTFPHQSKNSTFICYIPYWFVCMHSHILWCIYHIQYRYISKCIFSSLCISFSISHLFSTIHYKWMCANLSKALAQFAQCIQKIQFSWSLYCKISTATNENNEKSRNVCSWIDITVTNTVQHLHSAPREIKRQTGGEREITPLRKILCNFLEQREGYKIT